MLLTADFAFSSYRLTKKSSFLFPAQKTPLIVNVGTFREMLVPAKNIFSCRKKTLALNV
jgi:hypothetical protein